jgi:hypothetical protein
VIPSNIEAVEACALFSKNHWPFVAVVGPSGWGKTHMLRAAATSLGPDAVVQRDAYEWITATTARRDLRPLLLDDVQDVLRSPRHRNRFRQAINLRAKAGAPTMLAIGSSTGTLPERSQMSLGREWHVARIRTPQASERIEVVRRIAAIEGIQLSESMLRLMSTHLHGNGHSLLGALRRLRLVKSAWQEPTDVMHACGLLSPYMMGQDGWDPRDAVFEGVSRSIPFETADKSRRFDLCAYFMLVEMGLSEQQVATFFGVSPGEVYAMAVRTQTKLRDDEFAQEVDDTRRSVVSMLQTSIV